MISFRWIIIYLPILQCCVAEQIHSKRFTELFPPNSDVNAKSWNYSEQNLINKFWNDYVVTTSTIVPNYTRSEELILQDYPTFDSIADDILKNKHGFQVTF